MFLVFCDDVEGQSDGLVTKEPILTCRNPLTVGSGAGRSRNPLPAHVWSTVRCRGPEPLPATQGWVTALRPGFHACEVEVLIPFLPLVSGAQRDNGTSWGPLFRSAERKATARPSPQPVDLEAACQRGREATSNAISDPGRKDRRPLGKGRGLVALLSRSQLVTAREEMEGSGGKVSGGPELGTV